MGDRGNPAGRPAADHAPRRENRHDGADRPGIHLPPGRYPERGSRDRSWQIHPGGYARTTGPTTRWRISRSVSSPQKIPPLSLARKLSPATPLLKSPNLQTRWARPPGSSQSPLVRIIRPNTRLHGLGPAQPGRGPQDTGTIRSAGLCRVRRPAHVCLAGSRCDAGRYADRADRLERLGNGQGLPGGNRPARGCEGNPEGPDTAGRKTGRRGA